jgi:hypothetical protein
MLRSHGWNGFEIKSNVYQDQEHEESWHLRRFCSHTSSGSVWILNSLLVASLGAAGSIFRTDPQFDWGDWDHSNWSGRRVNANCWTICVSVEHSTAHLSASFHCLFPSRIFTRFHCPRSLLDTPSHNERSKAQSGQKFTNTPRDFSGAAAPLLT